MRVEFTGEAKAEARSARKFYEAQKPGLGRGFNQAIQRAIERIERSPQAHALVTRRARRCRLERFPYYLVYQARLEVILIVAVAHDKRQPQYWAGRLPKQ